ncbi:N-acetylmuramoyl-L-alanine amidase [Segnochrobactrum spirostomi]|uniref:N-acetylmuramoyl-L-alanine amidase n=1 Tax=Segnochrobactrum spirostomi TaxID=2608987 RepID=A0A6A7Y5L7_9HYPH|nr:N-acetylmuramoyl-L-alanine amidase [Segnochrobactrum spirostomi]MQT14056.1 N-acetylmuramoyl-L-alanine amidase [Segnochrobactrum spirostomi]
MRRPNRVFALAAAALLFSLLGLSLVGAGRASAAAGDAASDPAATAPRTEPVAPSGLPIALGARVAGDTERTRLVIDLSSGLQATVFPLADPNRVVIDLPEIRFDLPNGTGEEGRGLITTWRYGLFAPGKSRIVVDTTGPVAIDRTFVLPAADGQPARLVVDLVPTTAAAFAAKVAEARAARGAPTTTPDGIAPDSGVTADRTRRTRPLIVLDPGHGGLDTGAVATDGREEKTITLPFAQLLAQKLAETGKFEVKLTRDDDTFLPLDRRVEIARELAADLFISIHTDSAPQPYVRGATVYTVSDRASDAEAAATAALENKSDIIAGVDLPNASDEVADILLDLARRETRNFSRQISNALVTEMKTTTKLNANPQRAAGFRVLRAHDVPSVLVELGYLTNKDDEARLEDAAWREKTAVAMVGAIEIFFGPRLAQGREFGGK